MIELENKIPVSITFSGYSNTGYETVYYFTGGALKVVNGIKLFKKAGESWEEITFDRVDNQLLLQLDAFYKMIIGEHSEISTGDYGANIIEAIEEIYAQS